MKAAAQTMIPLLRDAAGDPALAPFAFESLGAMGPIASTELPLLIAQGQLSHLRLPIVRVVEQFGPAAASAVPLLVSYLDEASDPLTIQRTLLALGAIGPAAAAALPRLEVLMHTLESSPDQRLLDAYLFASNAISTSTHLIDDAKASARSDEAEMGSSSSSALPWWRRWLRKRSE